MERSRHREKTELETEVASDEVQHDARKEESKKKGVDGVACQWQSHGRHQDLQRLCEAVYTDPDETQVVQEGRIEYFRRKGDQHFTEDGRGTIDLVLQARANMSENKSTDLKTPLQAR